MRGRAVAFVAGLVIAAAGCGESKTRGTTGVEEAPNAGVSTVLAAETDVAAQPAFCQVLSAVTAEGQANAAQATHSCPPCCHQLWRHHAREKRWRSSC